ncbi:MAG: ribosome assembly RNA-binding protein YhbY [Desulfobacteraceae bacterium]|nr:ribosome assembly RNA-binding protein YhbY [Desulfobacteraceae bacterium]
MQKLKGYQRSHLRGLAHNIKPVVFIGQKGLSASVIDSVNQALYDHELIKIKFQDIKEKDKKKAVAEAIEKETESEMVGMIGHMAIFYRKHPDTEKQKINLPE